MPASRSFGAFDGRRVARALLAIPVALAAVATLAAAPALAQDGAPAAPPSVVPLPPLRVIDTGYVDRAANACTDFNLFANGGWLKRDTIPAAYASSGVSRDMADRNELVVRAVLDDAVRRAPSLPATSTEHKLGVFYGTCMDSTAAERAGVEPIRPILRRIDAVLQTGCFESEPVLAGIEFDRSAGGFARARNGLPVHRDRYAGHVVAV